MSLDIPDVDECVLSNGGCSSMCTNVPGSFRCGCADGERLSDDKQTCSGNTIHTYTLFFSRSYNVTKFFHQEV